MRIVLRSQVLLTALLALFCAAMSISSSAQALTTIYNFCAQQDCPDGALPVAGLVQGSDGNLYGTTSQGGRDGTVFKVTPSGALTNLHTFTGNDGANPQSNLMQANDGNYYGTTFNGGANNDSGCAFGGYVGCGTIFKITPAGSFSVIYSFCAQQFCLDGALPSSALVQGSDGNLYGTAGGVYTGGTFFKITPQGTMTTLYLFCSQLNCTDGEYPSTLIQGKDGNFYGTTYAGGNSADCTQEGSFGCGTVFKITPQGALTILHNFSSADGCYPEAGLTLGSDGNFYGTTLAGGANGYCNAYPSGGTVFKITPAGQLTTLYSFCSASNCSDGEGPFGEMVQDTDGNLYGTTNGGGISPGRGTIFKITSSGAFTSVYLFCSLANCADGILPYGNLMQASDKNIYGTTYEAGTNGGGTVYRFQPNAIQLTVSVSGGGNVTSTDGYINCPGSCSHQYSSGTPVTLNAAAGSGWSFGSWGGACSGSSPSCALTMSQSQLVSATFTQYNYTLTVTNSGDGSITSTDGFINCPGMCSHLYPSNTVVALNANPSQGWSLSTWGGACSGNGPTCNLAMTGEASASASFAQGSYSLTVSLSGTGTLTSTDGNINCPGTCSHTYSSPTQVTLNASPSSGWSFSGWTGACIGVGPCTLSLAQNLFASGVFVEPGAGFQFTPVTPCRLVDTRLDQGPPLQANTATSFAVPQEGTCGATIPSNAAAYSLNVTVVPVTTLNYLTIWPSGEGQPVVSTMNSPDGRVKANAAIVPAGANGAVSVYVTDTTHVILDIDGYFAPASAQTYEFYPLTPCRVVDTRQGSNQPQGLGPPTLAAQQQRDLPILKSPCLNGIANPLAYSFNATVVPNPSNQPLGYLTVWPSNQAQPTVSTLNNPTATVVANAAIVPASPDGDIDVYAFNATDLILDINGYFAAPGGQNALSLYPVAPCRVLDTRNNNGSPFMGEKTVNVVGSPCAPPSSGQAYVFNATVVPPGPMPYLTLWPDGQQQPVVSTLNAYDSFITSNMAIVPSTNGSIDAFAAGLTQLILDISGYFAP